jgi:hypothetical protein
MHEIDALCTQNKLSAYLTAPDVTWFQLWRFLCSGIRENSDSPAGLTGILTNSASEVCFVNQTIVVRSTAPSVIFSNLTAHRSAPLACQTWLVSGSTA